MMDYTQPDKTLYGLPFTANAFNGMPYQPLGPSGLWTARVGLGTWKFGYPETEDESRVNRREALRILDRAIELGVTFWDTANRYNNSSGNSERLIGEWCQANPDQRRNIVIATKLMGLMDGRTPNHCRLSRANILDAVHASLQRMQIDYIDLLYFHRYDEVTPVDESLETICDLVSRGLVRYLAVSNFTVDQLKLYQAYRRQLGSRCQVLAVQNQFDIIRGEAAAYPGVLNYCAKNDLAFVAHQPLANGLLTNRYLDLAQVGPGDRLYDEGTLSKIATEATLAKVKRLAALATQWDMRLSQLTLAYTLSLPGMGPVIPGVSTVAQLEENAAVGAIKLSDEQKMAIKQALQGVV
jgi:aryl-alcohol dehydrogenase-like predicted oxidoreductase